jgi:uncharacterized protein
MNGSPSIFRNINEVHLEVTNCCNLSCKYCYVKTIHKNKIDVSDHMSIKIVEDIINEIARDSTFHTVKIVFHGGEPLLVDSQWYEKVFPLIKNIFAKVNKKAILCIQTNLTLLSDAMLDLIKKYRVIISTSIDGPEDVHNTYRGLFRKTAENIKKINEIGLLGGVITVFHFHNYDKLDKIIATLKDLGIKRFIANFAYAMGRGRNLPILDSEKRLKVYKDLIDYTINTQGGDIIEYTTFLRIKRFNNPPDKMELLSDLSCYTPFCHAGIKMLMIKPNGDIYPCGFSGGLGTNEYFKLGNIYNLNKGDFKEKIIKFHQKGPDYYEKCQSCEARIICFFGCPAAEYEDKNFKKIECIATKNLFRYLIYRQRELNNLFKSRNSNDEYTFN